MSRYLIEVAYKGTHYAGFQIQQNANTIQAEVEKALNIFYKEKFELTGSSRTDAGVHALQNFFHFDIDIIINNEPYHLNSILPDDIVVKKIISVESDFHCRFNATSRQYKYHIYQSKNPFLKEVAYHYPYNLDISLLNQAAQLLMQHTDFTSFSKKHTQTFTNNCTITISKWYFENQQLIYTVQANRFLRGMVKALVATMLQVGTNKLSIKEFEEIIQSKNNSKAFFTAPAHGLFLVQVNY
jgi:tRNA pseudouridine38-40 synthase